MVKTEDIQDVCAVIFGSPAGGPGDFRPDFQHELMDKWLVTIANNVPHLAPDAELTKLWWKAVAHAPKCKFILPVQGYKESEDQHIATLQSFTDHGSPDNVYFHHTGILDEPGTRSDRGSKEYEAAIYYLEMAEQLDRHPLVTHPYPVPGIAPADWMRPLRAGWRLSILERGKALGLTPDQFGCEEWCGYLIDADFAEMTEWAVEDTILGASSIGSRLVAVGASWLLINDLSELPRLFTKTGDQFTGLTALGKALLAGLKAVG